MDGRTRVALRRVAHALAAAGIPYQLGGSGLLFALGLLDRVGDLDIVFPSGARGEVAQVLRDLTGAEPRFDARQEPGFVSDWRCRHELDGQPLDLSGGVAVLLDGREIELPFRAGGIWDLEGTTIPLAPSEQWLLIYLVHGSPRAELLAPHVDRSAWEGQRRDLGLSERWSRA
jgi:hypothetical protein